MRSRQTVQRLPLLTSASQNRQPAAAVSISVGSLHTVGSCSDASSGSMICSGRGQADGGLRLLNILFTFVADTDTSPDGQRFAGLASGPIRWLRPMEDMRESRRQDSAPVHRTERPNKVVRFALVSKVNMDASRQHCQARALRAAAMHESAASANNTDMLPRSAPTR